MDLFTFKGGVHPYDGKELSKDNPIKPLKPKNELAYLVSQHIGAPAKPIVAKGDRVLAGQMIAEAGGFVSAPIYASVSGTVKGIEPRLTAVGATCNAIIVENDGLYETVKYTPCDRPESLSKEEIRKKIQEAGVVGMGGAGFPTHVKLTPKEPEKIDYILVNGAECEPYLTSDYRRMLEEPEKVVEGLKVILQLFDNAKGCICIENNKPDCIEKLSAMVENEPRIEVKPLKTKYPQGAERMLIHAVTGRSINSSMLPADAGCVVDNIDTVVAVYKAVILGQPLMHRIVTVTGDAVEHPSNFYVPVGTDFQELLEAAGGLKKPAEKIISGGPMMGFAMFDIHVPVTKTTSALLCMSKDDVSRSETTACINCGKCVSACPEHLLPTKLARFSEHKEEDKFLAYNGMECCECGCCSYVCPAKRPLAQDIKSMRKIVLANRKKK
ncbi:MAG: electron transport complex subunit RsxC [Clostridia bacterium]|nr:electron transport complex subunit RsxC [Clostridia bacterium]NCC43478.1 electron transport complex subunit RsxC [Clostridia bacterium]